MGKLVRDGIPDIIRSSGDDPDITVLTGHELLAALKDKLVEEARELQDAPEDEALEELADVAEVLDALIVALSPDPLELARVREAKRRNRGGFTRGYWLA